MSSDRDLLEWAAKAAGVDGEWAEIGIRFKRMPGVFRIWNPLTDDGDALRLAVKLRITVEFKLHIVDAQCGHIMCHEPLNGDTQAATRRAIVRAAAEIGTGNS